MRKNQNRVTLPTFRTLREIGICATSPTKRGTKGSMRLKIPAIITRSYQVNNLIPEKNSHGGQVSSVYKQRGCCLSNLAALPLVHFINESADDQNAPSRTGNISLALLNPWSVCNKPIAINDFITDQNLDLLALCETWLKGDQHDDVVIQEMLPPNYKLLQQARKSRGGGIGLIHHDQITVKHATDCDLSDKVSAFEVFQCDALAKQSVRVVIIYRPPPSKKNGFTFRMFITQFADFLEQCIIPVKKKCIILGDFNIHIDDPCDRDGREFLSVLDQFGLAQHVQGRTHKNGHTLDLVVTRSCDKVISSIHTQDHGFPDHFPVLCQLTVHRPVNKKQRVSYRKFKAIIIDDLTTDIKQSDLCTQVCTDSLDDMVSQYNNTLGKICDHHAPLKTRTLVIRPQCEWYTSEVRAAKQDRRKVERLWRKTGLTVHREIYLHARNRVNDVIKSAKTDFYQNKIAECHRDSKELFRITNTLLGKKKTTTLPNKPHDELVEEFSNFFVTKVANIRSSIQLSDSDSVQCQQSELSSLMTNFNPATTEEIHRIIVASPSKQCALDPLPTKLVKACSPHLSPVITQVINTSLEKGVVPTAFKDALVTPVLKKPTLDPEAYNNFRPVSNLPFISKVLEKVVAARLNEHLTINNLHEPFQSAYRKFHSTETATLRVHNDLQCALGEGKCSLLVMIDLSAAFDTVDHCLMIHRLQQLGIKETAIQWFDSYLENRRQSIIIQDVKSSPRSLDCGVPQGSVLGPVMFTLYTAPLGTLLSKRGLYHTYADDTMMYLIFKPNQLDNKVRYMEETARIVRSWMATNSLKMNDSKTEVMLVTPKHLLSKLHCPDLEIGAQVIQPSRTARSLGVHFDNQLSMEHHVNTVCRSAYMHLHNLHKIKPYLDNISLERLIHAFITTKLDYGNAVLLGYPQTLLQKLQRVQNSAARMLTGTSRYQHITPVLYDLHWLPVVQRIHFKVAVLLFKSKNHLAPIYLEELVQPYVSTRTLRSSDSELLRVPFTRSSLVAQRAFSVAGPTLWNTLPAELRQCNELTSFKRLLKTFLFKQFYDSHL